MLGPWVSEHAFASQFLRPVTVPLYFVPPCPPCLCACPFHTAPALAPAPSIGASDRCEDEDSDEYIHFDEADDIPLWTPPPARWADSEEVMIRIDHSKLLQCSDSVEFDMLREWPLGYVFGILFGAYEDSINVKVSALQKLTISNPAEDSSTDSLHRSLLHVLEQLKDGRSAEAMEKPVGWAVFTAEMGCLPSTALVNEWKSLSTPHSNSDSEGETCPFDLLMILDVSKTKVRPEFPCMEFYHLPSIPTEPTTNGVAAAALAYTF